ncbi:peptidoglycan DD-metalloendopeptidase family protein [Patescibacteria group bacterium]
MFSILPLNNANAGVFSFITDLFIDSEVEYVDVPNSQNMALLHAALNIDPNQSKGGGEVIIVEDSALLPEVGPSGTVADIEEKSSSDQISVYVVREGDSLSQIASMFDVSVNTIIWANDIKRGNLIKEGQTLVILPISGVRYEVKKGDTLASISKKYKGDLGEILQFNDLTKESKLAIGDIVVIPDGEMAMPKYSSSSASSRVRGSGGPEYKGYYIRPVVGRKSQGLHGYNAIDIAASTGTPVVASASGKVIISRAYGWNGGYGGYIVIRHGNGTQTLYSHNSKNIVYSGQYVVQGQVIGYVGSTGKSTGPHVHFEIRGAKNPF